MEGAPMPASQEPVPEKYAPEEIKKLNAERGGFLSGMSRRGEMEKNPETGAWEATGTDEGAELIERAKKEMEKDLAARPPQESAPAPAAEKEEAALPSSREVAMQRAESLVKEEKKISEEAEGKEKHEAARQWEFTDRDLDDMKKDAERAEARYARMLAVSRESGLQDVHAERYRWIAEQKRNIYERALEIVHPEMQRIEHAGQEIMTASFEKEAKKKRWPWIKERIKGVATLGIWEFVQAEKFRKTRRGVAEIIGPRAESLHQLEKLDIDEAWLEAAEIKRKAGKGASAETEQKILEEITDRKKEENDALIAKLVRMSERYVLARLGAARVLGRNMFEYRSAAGERVLTEEKLSGFRAALEAKLRSYQNGEVIREGKELRRIVSEKLDPAYWSRYVYGGVEAVLGGIGYKLLITHAFSGIGAKAAGTAKEGGAAVKEPMMAMKDHIWGTAKTLLERNGVSHPANSQVLEVAKKIAVDNGIGVKEWGIAGKTLATHMQQGYLLKVGGALQKVGVILGL